MKKDDVLRYFDGRVVELGMAFEPPLLPQAIYKWEEVPPLRQIQLQVMTQGALKADPGLLPGYILKRVETPHGVTFQKVYQDENSG